MSFSYYKVLWLFVHAVFSIAEAIFHFSLEFRDNFCNFIKKISQSRCKHTSTSDRHLIESQLHELKKLPKHMGVILSANSETDVDVQKLTCLVTWALSSGINFISFYDYKGREMNKVASTSSTWPPRSDAGLENLSRLDELIRSHDKKIIDKPLKGGVWCVLEGRVATVRCHHRLRVTCVDLIVAYHSGKLRRPWYESAAGV